MKCPSCQTYLATGEAGPSSSASGGPRPGSAILTQYKNEGGLQANLDILPAVTEEAYLSNNPEARPARAFQLMCSEGDVGGMVELLEDIDGAGDENISVLSVLRYQDPLSNMKTGLHLAIERGQVDVAFLLLWLCSSASDTEFPEDGRNTAQILGLGRLTLDGNADIRLLKDGNGLTASDYARQSTEPWSRFLNGGLL